MITPNKHRSGHKSEAVRCKRKERGGNLKAVPPVECDEPFHFPPEQRIPGYRVKCYIQRYGVRYRNRYNGGRVVIRLLWTGRIPSNWRGSDLIGKWAVELKKGGRFGEPSQVTSLLLLLPVGGQRGCSWSRWDGTLWGKNGVYEVKLREDRGVGILTTSYRATDRWMELMEFTGLGRAIGGKAS